MTDEQGKADSPDYIQAPTPDESLQAGGTDYAVRPSGSWKDIERILHPEHEIAELRQALAEARQELGLLKGNYDRKVDECRSEYRRAEHAEQALAALEGLREQINNLYTDALSQRTIENQCSQWDGKALAYSVVLALLPPTGGHGDKETT